MRTLPPVLLLLACNSGKPRGYLEYDPSTCDVFGVEEFTVQRAFWLGEYGQGWFLDNDQDPTDMLQVTWAPPAPTTPHDHWLLPGIGDDDHFVLIGIDCNTSTCAERYWAVSGYIDLTEGGAPYEPLRGTVEELMLDQITITPMGETPEYMEGGRRWCVEYVEMDAILEETLP